MSNWFDEKEFSEPPMSFKLYMKRLGKLCRAYDNAKPEKPTSKLARAAATVGGAYAGSKLVPKLTKGKIGSKTGAGIGAIAGYWASGRKKV